MDSFVNETSSPDNNLINHISNNIIISVRSINDC